MTGEVAFIKSDTDGFDNGVFNSGLYSIAQHRPIIYFENTNNPENITGYLQLYDSFEEMGYNHVVIFANCECIMFEQASWVILKQLNKYMMQTGISSTPNVGIPTYRVNKC